MLVQPKTLLTVSRLHFLLLSCTALSGIPAIAGELPSGGRVAQGSASISVTGPGRMVIGQNSAKAVVNWQDFSIGKGARVDIRQPSSKAAMLNRVTGTATSSIAGQLNANGQVFLINPNGIVIGKTGEVRTGGFAASSLGMTDSDFMAGRHVFTGNGASATVFNEGLIEVGRGGYAALIGGRVKNTGAIVAPLGRIGLGAGERAVLDLSGDGFLQVALPSEIGGDDALIDVAGTLAADGGLVEIRAATARDAARRAVNLSGVVEARSVGGRSGAVILGGGDGGQVRISGRVDVSAPRQTELVAAAPPLARPAEITVTGVEIALAGATLDASGPAGGGSIRVGGDLQGAGTLQRAVVTSVDATSVIHADATESGDGGTIILWSDGLTYFAGHVSAKGGPEGGSGGFAEVSGKARLAFTGTADLSAAKGGLGTLLLDPYNVFIEDGPTSGIDEYAGEGSTSFLPSVGSSVLNASDLEAALESANVTISSGSIYDEGIEAGNIAIGAPISWVTPSALTLQAFGEIIIAQPISAPLGTLSLYAGYNYDGEGSSGGRAITTPVNWYASDGSLQTGGNGAIDVGTFQLIAGDWRQTGASLPDFASNDFLIDASEAEPYRYDSASFLRASGGSGVPGAPWLIEDIYGLQGVGSAGSSATSGKPGLSNSYALTGDIDARAAGDWNSGEGFNPIGTDNVYFPTEAFLGTFDGRGQIISGLTMSPRFSSSSGLFAVTGAGSDIRDLGLEGVDISGTAYTGALVGRAEGGTITNVWSTGRVDAASIGGFGPSGRAVGGLVGESSAGISRSYSTAAVEAPSLGSSIGTVGGLVGVNNGVIADSHATGSVTAASDIYEFYAGGLVGDNAGTITRAYATGDVTATGEEYSVAGGLAATNTGEIFTAYATGNVTADTGGPAAAGGGFAGYNSGDIGDAYAIGEVAVSAATEASAGGFVGISVGGNITRANATGSVSASGGLAANAGGFAGSSSGDISIAYASGDVVADSGNLPTAGGFAGSNSGSLSEVYATGPVSAVGYFEFRNIGGLVGDETGSVSASYWDTITTGQPDAVSGDGMTGLSTAQFQNTGDFMTQAGAAGWDFETDWSPPSSGFYPELYATSPVVWIAATDEFSTYGSEHGPFSAEVYGGPGTYVFGPDGDTLNFSAAVSSSATAASDVGAYPINVGGPIFSAEGTEYRVVGTDGVLTVDPATLEISAGFYSRDYGDPNPAFEAEYCCFVLDEGPADLGGVLSFVTDATRESDVGVYGVDATGLTSTNYEIIYISDGFIDIAPAPLTIAADNASRPYGAENPDFTAPAIRV